MNNHMIKYIHVAIETQQGDLQKQERTMSDEHKVFICTVAWGGAYPRALARMIQQFAEHSPGYQVRGWCNVLPPGTPHIEENGYDYTGYAAKPFALRECMEDDATIAILLDASFYPVRDIGPLVDHIAQTGYYLCDNGFHVGEWTSDRALEWIGFHTREDLMQMKECSSYCVGLNFKNKSVDCKGLLNSWCRLASSKSILAGPHENTAHQPKRRSMRNPGWCSADPRVKGHRHDQSILSILAHQYGMTNFIPRPKYTCYKAGATAETVLVNDGIN